MLTINERVAHSETDPSGVVLPVDPVSDVIEQPSNGGLLQGHSGRQAAADQSRPHFPNTVPVPRACQGDTTVYTQQAVECTLNNTNAQTFEYNNTIFCHLPLTLIETNSTK